MCYIKKTISVKIRVICVINVHVIEKVLCTGSYSRLVCVKSPHSLDRISLVRVLTQTAREYNPVQSTFYDVNYIFDKKSTEDDSGSQGKFWRRNRQRERRMRRGSNSHQSICELRTNAVDSKLSFSLETWSDFFDSKSLEWGQPDIMLYGLCCFLRRSIIVIFLDFHSTKQGLPLVDSWSRGLD